MTTASKPTPGDVFRRFPTAPPSATVVIPPSTPHVRPAVQDIPAPMEPQPRPFRPAFQNGVIWSRLRPEARQVALTLAAFTDYETGEFTDQPGLKRLTRATGLNPHVVRGALHHLREAGWLTRETTASEDGALLKITLLVPSKVRS